MSAHRPAGERGPLSSSLALGSLSAIAVVALATIAPPSTFALGLVAVLAVAALLALASGRLPSAPWAPWLAAVATAGALSRLTGPGSPLSALAVVACVSAAVALPATATVLVVGSAISIEMAAVAWARFAGGPVPARHAAAIALAAAAGSAAAGFLAARLRTDRQRLLDQLSALTTTAGAEAAAAPPPDDPSEPAPAPSAMGDMSSLLELTRRAVRARSCVLFERSLDPPCWRIAAAASVADDFDGLAEAPLGHGLVAWAAKHEVPMRLSDGGPQLRTLPHYSTSATGSFLAVPLTGGPALSVAEPSAEPGGAWAVLACDSPSTRHFDEASEELLTLHAAEIGGRLATTRELARARHDLAAYDALTRSTATIAEASGAAQAAAQLLAAARAATGATAGAVVLDEARSGGPAVEGGRGPVLLAADGLGLGAGHRLEAAEESWATWSIRRPDVPVRLPAFGPDRGMPRIARGDQLDAAWSFAAWPLAGGPEEVVGSLALAWADRRLPGTATLDAVAVLAQVGAAVILREEARDRLALGRAVDHLTGLGGRPAAIESGRAHAQRVRQGGGRLSLACFDLDRSGRLQATDGPAAWEAAVEALARTLRAALPASAELYRWGADEFVAVLPGAGEEGALVAARRAASAVAQGLGGRPASAGAGIATLAPDREDFDQLLQRAHAALAVARQVGGGKVVAAQKAQ